jgi:hypothetical protein
LRTRVGEPPREIQRSEIQPAQTVVAAIRKKEMEVIRIMPALLKPRSLTKYVGNQVSRKNQK